MAQVQTKSSVSERQLDWTRLVLTSLATIAVMGLVGWDEVALGAPIIFFVETLGFWMGLWVFIITWALLGYTMLLFVDYAWPLLKPAWESFLRWIRKQWERYGVVITIVAASAIVSGVVIGFRYFLLYTAIAMAAVVFVGLMEAVRQMADRWVRSIDPRRNKYLRWIGALVALVILGPVLSWTLLKWLQFTRAAVYVLTIPAAVIFGCIWVPYYSLGVWGLGLSRLF